MTALHLLYCNFSFKFGVSQKFFCILNFQKFLYKIDFINLLKYDGALYLHYLFAKQKTIFLT